MEDQMQNKKVLIVADPSVYYDGSKRVVPYDEEISMYRDALVQYGIPCEVIDRLGDLSDEKINEAVLFYPSGYCLEHAVKTKKRHPAAKIVLATAFNWAFEKTEIQGVRVLLKPFLPDYLVQVLLAD